MNHVSPASCAMRQKVRTASPPIKRACALWKTTPESGKHFVREEHANDNRVNLANIHGHRKRLDIDVQDFLVPPAKVPLDVAGELGITAEPREAINVGEPCKPIPPRCQRLRLQRGYAPSLAQA